MVALIFYIASLFILANSGLLAKVMSRADNNVNAHIIVGERKLFDTEIRLQDIENYRDVDVLLIGSSITYSGYNKMIFEKNGLNAFNLGTAAQSPMNSYFLLRKYVEKFNPELILVECFWNQFADPSESTIDLIASVPLNEEFNEMALATRHINAINAVLIKVLSFKNKPIPEISMGEDIDFFNDGEKIFTYVSGGFRRMYGIWEPKELDLQTKEFYKPGLEYLKRIADLTCEREIEMILVSPPVSKEIINSLANYDEIIKEINTFADRIGIRYLNFHNLDLVSSNVFYDQLHLNHVGAEVFTEALFEKLTETGFQ